MNPSNVSPPTNSPDPGASSRNQPGTGPTSTTPMTDAARVTAEQLKTAASDTAAQIKNKVSSTTSQLKAEATHAAEDRKREVAERIGGYSSALHDSGKRFESEDPNIAWLAHQAAERLQGVADYVRQCDLHRLRTDTEAFARRHPAVVIGSMFVVGLLVGSALRAGRSALRENDSTRDYDYDPETRPGEAFTSSTPIAPESSEI